MSHSLSMPDSTHLSSPITHHRRFKGCFKYHHLLIVDTVCREQATAGVVVVIVVVVVVVPVVVVVAQIGILFIDMFHNMYTNH